MRNLDLLCVLKVSRTNKSNARERSELKKSTEDMQKKPFQSVKIPGDKKKRKEMRT